MALPAASVSATSRTTGAAVCRPARRARLSAIAGGSVEKSAPGRPLGRGGAAGDAAVRGSGGGGGAAGGAAVRGSGGGGAAGGVPGRAGKGGWPPLRGGSGGPFARCGGPTGPGGGGACVPRRRAHRAWRRWAAAARRRWRLHPLAWRWRCRDGRGLGAAAIRGRRWQRP